MSLRKGDRYDGVRVATVALLLAIGAACITWAGVPVIGQLTFLVAFAMAIYGAFLHVKAMVQQHDSTSSQNTDKQN